MYVCGTITSATFLFLSHTHSLSKGGTKLEREREGVREAANGETGRERERERSSHSLRTKRAEPRLPPPTPLICDLFGHSHTKAKGAVLQKKKRGKTQISPRPQTGCTLPHFGGLSLPNVVVMVVVVCAVA